MTHNYSSWWLIHYVNNSLTKTCIFHRSSSKVFLNFAIQMSLDIAWSEVMWGHPKKIILIGEISVGKTSVMRRFVHRTFEGAMKATIGADFMVKEIELGQERIQFTLSLARQWELNTNLFKSSIVTLQIWDTAGGERFQSLGTYFYMAQFDWSNRFDQSEQFIWMKIKIISRQSVL